MASKDPKFLDPELNRLIRIASQGRDVRPQLRLVIAREHHRQGEHLRALRHLAFLASEQGEEAVSRAFPEILDGLGPSLAPERVVMRALRHDVSIDAMASFTTLMNERARKKQMGTYAPESVLSAKPAGHRFARTCGIAVPEQGGHVDPLTCPLRPGTVLKPQDWEGARGVILIHAPDNAVHAKTGQVLTSEEEIRVAITASRTAIPPHRDTWVEESLLYEDRETFRPARDLKFYCFYGRVGLVMEVVAPRTSDLLVGP